MTDAAARPRRRGRPESAPGEARTTEPPIKVYATGEVKASIAAAAAADGMTASSWMLQLAERELARLARAARRI